MTVSKLLNSVLDRVSENNNEYRGILRSLNSLIDEKTTTLVGDVVTASGYTADFSNTLTSSKENLVNPISRIISSYVIKDLRSVETVNEQFVEKINDKLENTNITSKEEKDAFAENLNSLLNDKYLEIVKIKRVDFLNENGVNNEVEEVINNFVNTLKTTANFDEETLNNLVMNYKKDVYALITESLSKISSLYLNNFVSEVSSALNGAIDFDDSSIYEENTKTNEEPFKPYIPEINPVPEAVLTPSDDLSTNDALPTEDLSSSVVPPVDNFQTPVVPEIPSIPEVELGEQNDSQDSLAQEENSEIEPIKVEPIAPIEVKEEEKETPKRPYDVEEILKIAKSPVVSVPLEKEEKDDGYVNVEPINKEDEKDTFDAEFNEREIVEEMIRRLTKRLEEIDERKSKYDEEKAKLEEDKAFVNDLIESSKVKKDELDKFEQELNDKEKELDEKQSDLDKKINDIMPFANAVLNSEKES